MMLAIDILYDPWARETPLWAGPPPSRDIDVIKRALPCCPALGGLHPDPSCPAGRSPLGIAGVGRHPLPLSSDLTAGKNRHPAVWDAMASLPNRPANSESSTRRASSSFAYGVSVCSRLARSTAPSGIGHGLVQHAVYLGEAIWRQHVASEDRRCCYVVSGPAEQYVDLAVGHPTVLGEEHAGVGPRGELRAPGAKPRL